MAQKRSFKETNYSKQNRSYIKDFSRHDNVDERERPYQSPDMNPIENI